MPFPPGMNAPRQMPQALARMVDSQPPQTSTGGFLVLALLMLVATVCLEITCLRNPIPGIRQHLMIEPPLRIRASQRRCSSTNIQLQFNGPQALLLISKARTICMQTPILTTSATILEVKRCWAIMMFLRPSAYWLAASKYGSWCSTSRTTRIWDQPGVPDPFSSK